MPRIHISARLQRIVIRRAKARCEYCQSLADYATETYAIEHIIPISRGGGNDLSNLALSCSGCNAHKYNKTTAPDPADGKIAQLFHPRLERWQAHFCWSEDYTRIIGLTPTGRATVESLQMNRPGLINMRKLLYLIGKHPAEIS